MYHTVEFTADWLADLEVSPKHPLEQVRIRKGTTVRAQLKPYVLETDDGLVEVADLFFENGTTTRRVPFSSFQFVD